MIYQKLKKITLRLLAFLRCQLAPYFNNIVVRYLQALYRKYLKKFLLRFYPMLDKAMMLALTYKCQCGCEHCGNNLYRKEGKEELKMNEILNLIDMHSKLGGRRIYFFGGEPLIVTELPYYIRYAKSRSLFTRLDTNGFLLDEDMVRQLKTSGLDYIGVSIDSPYETVHDELRKLKGIFNRAINGIKYCKKYRIKCYISTYATKENLKNGDLVRLINLAKDIGVEVRILSSICSGKWFNRRDVVLSPDEITLLKSLTEKGKVYWEDTDDKEAPFSCPAFRKAFFYVSSYGDVQPCCYLPITFGNVREESLGKIITRMYYSDVFTRPKRLDDCLANDENFVNIHLRSVESEPEFPVPFKYCPSAEDVKEWDEWASSYSKEADHLLGINDDVICSRINFTDKRVLDVGCGTGRFVKAIVKDAKHVTLLDFSNKMLDEAKKELREFNNVDFRNINIEKAACFVEGEFDIIVVISLLHHLKDTEQVIEKLKSYLQTRGKLVILENLANRPLRDNHMFYFKVIRKYGIMKLLQQFCYNSFSNSRIITHLSKENYTTYEDFKNKYASLLPGAEIEVTNGIFGLVVWSKGVESVFSGERTNAINAHSR